MPCFRPNGLVPFKNNPAKRMFRFLDEEATWVQDVQMLASLLPALFLQAWAKTKLLHPIQYTGYTKLIR